MDYNLQVKYAALVFLTMFEDGWRKEYTKTFDKCILYGATQIKLNY